MKLFNNVKRIIKKIGEKKKPLVIRYNHHPWCNYWEGDPTTCKHCDRLYTLYPVEGLTPDELLKKHFPDVERYC